MKELGVDLSDLPDEHSMEQCASACIEAGKWSKYTDHTVPYEYILHLVDVIDRMETRIINLTGEREYLLDKMAAENACAICGYANPNGGCVVNVCKFEFAGVPENRRLDDD